MAACQLERLAWHSALSGGREASGRRAASGSEASFVAAVGFAVPQAVSSTIRGQRGRGIGPAWQKAWEISRKKTAAPRKESGGLQVPKAQFAGGTKRPFLKRMNER